MKLKKLLAGVVAVTTSAICMIPSASYAATTNILLGDSNGDGYVNIADATFINQYLGGAYATNAKNFTAMDINEDGIIDQTDQYMLQYLEANPNAPTKAGTTVRKECYTLPVNTAVQYRRHDCSDSNLKSYKTYTIPVANTTDSFDSPVAYASEFNTKDKENVACVEISSSIGLGSGFIVSNNTIATAAHCIYNASSNEFAKNVKVKVYVDENVSYTASAEFLHMPSKYINGNDCDVNYDYALIRVGDFKDKNGKKVNVGNYSVNFGIMTDEFINAEKGSLTSVGYTTVNDIRTRYQSTGVISSEIPSHEYAYRYHIKAKSIAGKSGGMTYFDSSYTNPGNNYTINTRSTVGVHTSTGKEDESYGVRVNLNLIRFYKMSKLFEGD